MLALFWEIGAGRVKVRPPQKWPRKALKTAGFYTPKCSRLTPGISAYIPAVSSALRPWSKPRSNSAVARPGERAPADRTGPRFRGGPLGIEGGLQHRVQRQDGLPEVSAIGPRPALPQHIALTVQRQASHFLVIVGAPFHYKGADSGLFLTGQLAQNITSRPAFSKGSESRSRRGCRASRDSHSTGSPPGAVPGGEPGAVGGVSFPVPKGSM